MSHQTWILIADSYQAKIYKTFKARLLDGNASGKDLILVHEFKHPESKKREQDLVSDKEGKFGNGTSQSAVDPKQHEHERFALELTKVLTQGLNQKDFDELILVVPPAFTGVLRKHISREVKKCICKEIEKDYTQIKLDEVVAHLRDHL